MEHGYRTPFGAGPAAFAPAFLAMTGPVPPAPPHVPPEGPPPDPGQPSPDPVPQPIPAGPADAPDKPVV